jgi:hypothetical protein
VASVNSAIHKGAEAPLPVDLANDPNALVVVDLAKDPSPWHLQQIAYQHLKNIACEKDKN